MQVFVISALRAVVEMLGLCLIGQGVLHLLAGSRRRQNAIYRLFELLTRPPRQVAALLLPRGASKMVVGALALMLLFMLWIGLAWLRKSL
ncbi:MAG: hypothetical protein KIS72_11770 [Luteimonas sp.]|nr:hypothetical protein [Luteimonas sp.]MCW5606125.1 hypothetical protein [Burkholderiales bacterium]